MHYLDSIKQNLNYISNTLDESKGIKYNWVWLLKHTLNIRILSLSGLKLKKEKEKNMKKKKNKPITNGPSNGLFTQLTNWRPNKCFSQSKDGNDRGWDQIINL